MPEIKFETGIVSFKLNDAAEVSFNPTDSAFVEQIFNTFDELDGKQEAYKAEIDRCADKKEIFAIARRRDAEMRDMIDGLFAKPVRHYERLRAGRRPASMVQPHAGRDRSDRHELRGRAEEDQPEDCEIYR